MILVPLFILIAMIGVKMQKGIFMSFLVLVATKSIMDAFWEIKLGPLSILAVQGILIPILYSEIFFKRKIIPKRWLDSAKIYVLALSMGLIWAIAVKPMATVETVILNVNIYLGFILIPIFITDQKRLKQLLIAVMICGIFPILVSVYQLNTGVVFQERQTVGLTRYVGFYHDAFPVRFFGLMTLISILIYQSVFNIKGFLFKGFILLLAGGAFVSIYAVFSKAGVGIIGLWIVLLLLFSKSKVKQSFSVLIGLLVIFLVFQWFGDGINRPVHNEFFRVLMVNGIIGVLILLVFILRKIKNIFKIHKNVRVFGMMLLGMYIIDCIGLVPGAYYYYNILVWGIFGTLLMKPRLFIKQK